jgi:hypothetical protein
VSKGNWKKIKHDDRKSGENDGFVYSCASNHEWFLTFKQISEIIESERENNCPQCEE